MLREKVIKFLSSPARLIADRSLIKTNLYSIKLNNLNVKSKTTINNAEGEYINASFHQSDALSRDKISLKSLVPDVNICSRGFVLRAGKNEAKRPEM